MLAQRVSCAFPWRVRIGAAILSERWCAVTALLSERWCAITALLSVLWCAVELCICSEKALQSVFTSYVRLLYRVRLSSDTDGDAFSNSVS